MIRGGLCLLGGAALALLLFWGLALLVAPPQQDIAFERVTINLMAPPEAPAVAQDEGDTEPESTPQPQAESPPESEPTPASDQALPEPQPEPEPEPQSQPVPEPEPEPPPEPVAQPRAEAESSPPPRPSFQPTIASSTDAVAAESRGRTQNPDASEGQGPIDVGELRPLNRVPPEYPRRAQRRGLEGVVELTFLVAPDGRVDADSVRVVEARPGNVFERAARKAVSQWRFEANGQLRRARQRLEFQLR